MLLRLTLLVCISTIFSTPIYAQGISTTLKNEVRALLNEGVTQHGWPGGVISVIDSDGSIFSAGAGLARIGVPIDTNRVFALASQTKMLTSIAILQMHEEGLLDIDDHVGAYIAPIPNLKMSIPLRDLLRHTGDVGEYWQSLSPIANDPANADSVFGTRRSLEDHLSEPNNGCGGLFCYANSNHQILGLVIESVTGNVGEDEIRSRVFAPLGLDQMDIAPIGLLTSDHNGAWDCGTGTCVSAEDANPTGLLTAMRYAAGSVGRPADMLRIVRSLDEGFYFSQATVEMMRNGGLFHPGGTFGFINYGLGTHIFEIAGDVLYGHQGRFLNFSRTFYNPELDIGFSIAVNAGFAENYVSIRDRLYVLLRDATQSVKRDEHQDLIIESDLSVFPNPIRTTGTVEFAVNVAGPFRLEYFDILGRSIGKSQHLGLSPGVHQRHIPADLAAGMYIVRLVGESTNTQKLFSVLR